MMGSVDAIPGVLREYDQWVCWRAKARDGKQTKIPIDPQTRSFASVNDPETWTAYELAAGAATAEDGIGFVFTDDDPFVGVDLDDCRTDDDLDPWAADVVNRLDSYTEISPSGNGLHVLVEGELPSSKSRNGSIECYDTARFFTMTGTHLHGTPQTIKRRHAAFNGVYRDYVETDSPTPSNEPAAGPPESDAGVALSDAEILEKAKHAKNGAKFRSLWNGNTAGYDSQSEADMALCCLLAFWTGNDPTRIDQLFRQSGLYRDKWDEVHYADGTTYGDGTIDRAIDITDDTFDGDDTDTTNETESRPTPQPADATDSDPLLEQQVIDLTERVTTLERRLAELERPQQTPDADHEAAPNDHETGTATSTDPDSNDGSGYGWTKLTDLFQSSDEETLD